MMSHHFHLARRGGCGPFTVEALVGACDIDPDPPNYRTLSWYLDLINTCTDTITGTYLYTLDVAPDVSGVPGSWVEWATYGPLPFSYVPGPYFEQVDVYPFDIPLLYAWFRWRITVQQTGQAARDLDTGGYRLCTTD